MKRLNLFFRAGLFLLLTACSTHYAPNGVAWRDYRIKQGAATDSSLLQMLQPYSDSIDKTMNSVLAEAAETLERKQPEGALGNLLADALLYTAQKKFGVTVHAAFINNGGIRLPVLQKGNITTGKVYELMPFDNVIVLQQLSGTQLQTFLDHISKRGGWPVSGLTYDIQNDRAVNISINGQPLNPAGNYTICNSDFVANGGDDCAMLRSIKQMNRNVLMRESFITYFKELSAQGKKITAPPGNRVRKLDP